MDIRIKGKGMTDTYIDVSMTTKYLIHSNALRKKVMLYLEETQDKYKFEIKGKYLYATRDVCFQPIPSMEDLFKAYEKFSEDVEKMVGSTKNKFIDAHLIKKISDAVAETKR